MMRNRGYLKSYKTALVTGATHGIGYEIARLLAAAGKELVLVARDRQRLQEVRSIIEKEHGIKAAVYACDLSCEKELRVFLDLIGGEIPYPDLLVNNAGISCYGEFHALSLAEQVKLMRLNDEAAVALTHRVLARMAGERKGGILNVASTSGFMPIPFNAVYSASKAFLVNFSLGTAKEVSYYGVRISCLCPGPVDTGFWRSAGMEDLIKRHKRLPDAGSVAAYALKLIDSGRPLGVPGTAVKLKQMIRFFLPLALLSEYLYRHMKPDGHLIPKS